MTSEEPTPGRRPFTNDDLFLYWHGEQNYHKGIECQECGAAVINTDKHVEFHNKVADL